MIVPIRTLRNREFTAYILSPLNYVTWVNNPNVISNPADLMYFVFGGSSEPCSLILNKDNTLKCKYFTVVGSHWDPNVGTVYQKDWRPMVKQEDLLSVAVPQVRPRDIDAVIIYFENISGDLIKKAKYVIANTATECSPLVAAALWYRSAIDQNDSDIGSVNTNGVWVNGNFMITTVINITDYYDVQEEIVIEDKPSLLACSVAGVGLIMELKD